MKKTKLLVLFGSICLILALVIPLTGCGPALTYADKPENELPPGIEKKVEASTEILPPSIAPVFFLEGSDYEMGYQYGYQAAEYIDVFKDNVWANMLRQGYTKEEIERRLKAWEYYNQKWLPEMSESLRGMVDGATDAGYPVTYSDVLLIHCEWDVWVGDDDWPDAPYPPVGEIEYPPKGCSAFGAWGSETTDGHIIGGTSADAGEFRAQGAICVFPETGNNFISTGDIGLWAWNFILNSKGTYITIQWTPTYERPEDNAYALNSMFFIVRPGRFADSAEDAREMLLEQDLGIGENYLVVDSEYACVVERTADLGYYREPGEYGEGDFLVNMNFTLIPEMDVAAPGNMDSEDRYDQFFDYLADESNQGKVDIEFAKMMYRNPPVARAGTGMVHLVSITDENIDVYICTGAAGKEDGGTRVFRIDPTYSFYNLELKDTPEEVTEDARRTANAYVRQAMNELNKLDYNDTRFAGLKSLLSQARSEYYVGKNAYDAAVLTSGNEALFNYSKSATAFTRCQAIARQVYNALVPPAMSPEDFGP